MPGSYNISLLLKGKTHLFSLDGPPTGKWQRGTGRGEHGRYEMAGEERIVAPLAQWRELVEKGTTKHGLVEGFNGTRGAL
jgi:hypothetical protein